MINKEGKDTFFRWHFRSTLGEIGMLEEEAATQHFSFHTQDLVQAIQRGDFPVWHLEIQTIDPRNLPEDFDPLDPTKEWPTERFPFKKVGEFTLNENVESFFADNENIAFNPARLPPGIVPSADKLLQARLFACNDFSSLFFFLRVLFLSNHFVNNADMDNQVHRLGVNFHMLPINSPKCPFRDNHFEGKMNVRPESRGAQEVNYFPSRMDTTTKESPCHPVDLEAVEGHPVRKDPPVHKTLDDFHQAGNRWRSFDDARKRRFSDRLALSLSGSRTTQEIRDIWLGYWSKVDETLGNMIRVYDRSLLWLAFFFLFPDFVYTKTGPWRHS